MIIIMIIIIIALTRSILIVLVTINNTNSFKDLAQDADPWLFRSISSILPVPRSLALLQ